MATFKRRAGAAVVLLAAWGSISACEPLGRDEREGFGTVELDSSCSPEVQQELVRAIATLHSFWYEEARRRFQGVAERDPECAIAFWGVAMTHWQPLWEPRGPSPEALRQGQEALEKARAASRASERERALVAALDAFYASAGEVDHVERVLAYERAMQRLFEAEPRDTEARVFYALSLLSSATALPPDKTYARQRRAGELLEPVLRAQPNHPGAAHYLIHAYDYPALAAGALEAALRYAQIAPAAPHAQHMPSHIFTRLGLWEDSIASNRRVIEVARRQGVVGEELHGMDYLVFALLQQGRDAEAKAVCDAIPKVEPGVPLYFAGLYAHAAIPARYAVERKQWVEAAGLVVPEGFPGGRYAWADAAVYFARALGAARSGSLEQATSDVERLASLRDTLAQHGEDYWAAQVDIQHESAAAWLLFAEGRRDEALATMRAAAALEDATDKHPVTPGWIVPARDLLGQMLLEMNRPREAADEFARVLASEPNRFGALYGAARAAELAGDAERARGMYRTLISVAPESERAEARHARAYVAAGEAG